MIVLALVTKVEEEHTYKIKRKNEMMNIEAIRGHTQVTDSL
jgi:hypothetical protein